MRLGTTCFECLGDGRVMSLSGKLMLSLDKMRCVSYRAKLLHAHACCRSIKRLPASIVDCKYTTKAPFVQCNSKLLDSLI